MKKLLIGLSLLSIGMMSCRKDKKILDTCPSGYVQCPNNGKCYDPNVEYVLDPCSDNFEPEQ